MLIIANFLYDECEPHNLHEPGNFVLSVFDTFEILPYPELSKK